MNIAKATLGGFPLRSAITEGWTFTEGVSPSQMVMGLRPQDAATLLAKNENPVDFFYEFDGKAITVRNLYVLHEVPDDNPNVKSVLVADWRVWWPNRTVERDYNIRRVGGFLRYISGLTQETAVVTPNVRYWEWSLFPKDQSDLKQKRVWNVLAILEDILEDIALLVPWKPNLSILERKGEREITNKVAVEMLSFSGDGGDAALNRIKSIVPGLGITLDENSGVVVFRKDMNGPLTIADIGLGPQSSSRPALVQVNNRLMRPAKVNVRMEYLIEMRADAHERGLESNAEIAKDDLYLVNVAPIPDPELIVNGSSQCQGTWVPFDDSTSEPPYTEGLITAWNNTGGTQITKQFIREALVPLGIDLMARFEQVGIDVVDQNVTARCATIQKHFRTTYQFSKFWINRFKTILPYRLAIINEATAGRAPAVCYSDYSMLPSVRGKLVHSIEDQWVFMDVKGYPDNGLIVPLTDPEIHVAPCDVEIVDADQGVLTLKWKPDVYGNIEQILPSKIVNPPNGHITRPNAMGRGPIFVDSVVEALASDQLPALSASDKKAILFSAVPASPNDNRRLHTVVVTPDMVEKASQGKIRLGECVGPEVDIFIGPNLVQCMIRWQDGRASDIKRLFGYGSGTPKIDDLILNGTALGQGAGTTGANIVDIAVAYATQLYVSLVDRIEGEQASKFNPDVKLRGWEESVQHVITPAPESKFQTIVKFERRIPRMNIEEFMDGSMRRAIFRLATPPAGR